jgi:hypothetical protein
MSEVAVPVKAAPSGEETQMQTKVIMLYRLREDATLEDYLAWSRDVDQRVTPQQPAVHRFEPYLIEAEEDGATRYNIIEDLEVESWEAWQKALETTAMKPVVDGFKELVDESSVAVYRGTKIV